MSMSEYECCNSQSLSLADIVSLNFSFRAFPYVRERFSHPHKNASFPLQPIWDLTGLISVINSKNLQQEIIKV